MKNTDRIDKMDIIDAINELYDFSEVLKLWLLIILANDNIGTKAMNEVWQDIKREVTEKNDISFETLRKLALRLNKIEKNAS